MAAAIAEAEAEVWEEAARLMVRRAAESRVFSWRESDEALVAEYRERARAAREGGK